MEKKGTPASPAMASTAAALKLRRPGARLAPALALLGLVATLYLLSRAQPIEYLLAGGALLLGIVLALGWRARGRASRLGR